MPRGIERTLVVVAVLVVALAGVGIVQSQQFDLADWSMIATYDVDEQNVDLLNYTTEGTLDSVVDCGGEWTLTTNETLSTSEDNYIQYAMDTVEGEIGYIRVENGTETKKVADCDVFTLESTQDAVWLTNSNCDGAPKREQIAKVRGRAPFDDPQDDDVTDPRPGFCVVAEVAGAGSTPPDAYPYTGTFQAWMTDEAGAKILGAEIQAFAGFSIDPPDRNRDLDEDCPGSYGGGNCDLRVFNSGPASVLNEAVGDFRGKIQD